MAPPIQSDRIIINGLQFPPIPILSITIEQLPEEVPLLLTHRKHLLGDNPVDPALEARRDGQ